MVYVVSVTRNVLPSGADRATSCVAIVPDAPVLFSTMNVLPVVSDNFCATCRAA
ncbi:hypothetical protein D3C71_2046910 [compost metagenome]